MATVSSGKAQRTGGYSQRIGTRFRHQPPRSAVDGAHAKPSAIWTANTHQGHIRPRHSHSIAYRLPATAIAHNIGVIHHADFTHHLIHCGHRITRPPHRRRFVEAGAVRRTDVAVRSRRRNPDSGHTGADHPTDFRGDACWSDAAVASGGFRRRRLPSSWCSRAALPPWLWSARAPASSSDSCLA